MGDGSKRYNSTFNYFYKDDGIYTIRLTIIDDEGASNTTTIRATILNQAPVAFHNSISIPTYTPYIFNTSECADIDGYVASVEWTFKDPSGGETTVIGNTSYQWTENGTYRVDMLITDDDGATDTYSFNVTVRNSVPWASFVFSPTDGLSVGDDISFDASSSLDLDGSIVSWTWYFGESPDSIGYGEMTTFNYSIDGYFSVELVVIDNDGGSNSTIKTLYIAPKNDPPVPDIVISAAEYKTNRTITFDGSGSSDPDGYIVKYTWDFGDGKVANGKSVTHDYYYPGSYVVRLTVEDNGGKTNSTTYSPLDITQAENLKPIAIIEVSKTEVVADTPVILDGRGSYDDDKNDWIQNYTWDFGDGTYAYASYVSHTYGPNDVGTKTVRLTVRDQRGAIGTAEATVTVLSPPKKNSPPVASFSFSPPEPILTGQTVHFDASSSSDSDGTIAGYTWLFGDGTFAEGRTVDHEYSDNNVYLVVLTVIDNDGGSGTISKDITVSNRPPLPAISVPTDEVQTLEALTFDAGLSSDEDGFIKSYTWIFGEETTKTGKVVTHTFTTAGKKKVTLKVMDNDGAINEVFMEITVTNRAPIAKCGREYTATEGDPVSFNARDSKDLDGTITRYEWDFGDGSSTGEGMETTHVYTLPADVDSHRYTVTLTVVDNDNTRSEEFTANVTVYKRPKEPKPPKPSTFIPGFGAVLAVAAVALMTAGVALRKKRRV
jgi:PKD repeat protein